MLPGVPPGRFAATPGRAPGWRSADGWCGPGAARHHRRVPRPPELSSLASSLEELARRITALADRAHHDGDEDLASELFAVERAVAAALRRLQRAAGR